MGNPMSAIQSGGAAMINATPYGIPANQYAQGNQGGGGSRVQAIVDFAKQNGLNLDAQSILNAQQGASNQDAANQQALIQQNSAYQAGIGNANQNQAAQRSMAINAQANNAQNVANQLQNLQAARAQNTQAILGAMQAGSAGLGRI